MLVLTAFDRVQAVANIATSFPLAYLVLGADSVPEIQLEAARPPVAAAWHGLCAKVPSLPPTNMCGAIDAPSPSIAARVTASGARRSRPPQHKLVVPGQFALLRGRQARSCTR